MRLTFNTIFKIFFSNFRNEFSICFSNFFNKISKICLSFLNFSKIILFKYCTLKFYFYLTQFLKYFPFILYTSKYFYNWLGPPLAPAWPPPEYKFWLRPWSSGIGKRLQKPSGIGSISQCRSQLFFLNNLLYFIEWNVKNCFVKLTYS